MECPSCGHGNQAGSVFCEQCGTRLPAGGVAPTGSAAGKVRCSRCGGENAPHMRFCVHCGNRLQEASAAGPAPSPGPASPGAAAPNPASSPGAAPTAGAVAPTPVAQAAASTAERVAGHLGGPLCGRCRGVGDPGAEFCKFCGARYADAQPAGEDVQSTAPGPHAGAPAQPAPAQPAPAQPAGQPAPAQPAPGPASPATGAATGARLVSILKDGSDGKVYALAGEQTDIGRTEGDVILGDDPYLSPRHARVQAAGGRYTLRDLASTNGIYVRLREPRELTHADMILMGQQVLRFEILDDVELSLGPASVHGVLVFGTPEVPRYARLVQYTTEGVGRDVHYLYRDDTVLGREIGDIVFTDDPFLSRKHASITVERSTKKVVLKDLGSSNGTALRLRGERVLAPGDQFRIGRHLFRFDHGGVR